MGRRIAFVSGRFRTSVGLPSRARLHTMAADGADVRHLADGLTGAALQPPAWSPDGRAIAVAAGSWKSGVGDHALYLVDADSGEFVRLADAVSGGAWSPDGTRLAFAQPDGAQLALYTIAADGAERTVGDDYPPLANRILDGAGVDSHHSLVAGRIEAALSVRGPPILCRDARRAAPG